MGLEIRKNVLEMMPGPYDPHAHPRVFDPIVAERQGDAWVQDGKAGLVVYTEAALKSGIVALSAMPNEFYRVPKLDGQPGETEIRQWPIATGDRAVAMAMRIQLEPRMPMTFHFGLDPSQIIDPSDESLRRDVLYKCFDEGGKDASALKIFGDISTGGNNVPTAHIPEIAQAWHQRYPKKPVIMHLENGNVASVLEAMYADQLHQPDIEIPIHIAHVSSQEELEAVIAAKQRDMNVTCEVTPHHLFATADEGSQIGGYGCMKPTLKTRQDIKFLWDNIQHIDMFASDCAPHKQSDKEAASPAFGVTNHTTMLPLLLGAVDEGKLSLQQLYDKLAIAPRLRFGLRIADGSRIVMDRRYQWDGATHVERDLLPMYGHNIFPKLEAIGQKFHLLGRVVEVQAGASGMKLTRLGQMDQRFTPSLRHLVRVV